MGRYEKTDVTIRFDIIAGGIPDGLIASEEKKDSQPAFDIATVLAADLALAVVGWILRVQKVLDHRRQAFGRPTVATGCGDAGTYFAGDNFPPELRRQTAASD